MSDDNKMDHPYYKIRDEYEVKPEEIFDWLKDIIPKIQLIGDYKGSQDDNNVDTDTPFDQFDSQCHKVG